MAQVRCPTCQRLFDVRAEKPRPLPFCSERCRQIDLGRWLREEYGMPWEPEDEADQWPGPPRRDEPEEEEE